MEDTTTDLEDDIELLLTTLTSSPSSTSFTEASTLLSELSLAISSLPAASQREHKSRLRSYEAQLASLRADFDRIQLLGPEQREDRQWRQRQQLLSGSGRLQQSSERVRNAERVAADTEVTGAEVLRNLKEQREMIEGTQKKVDESEGYLDSSLKTLKNMARWQKWSPF